VAELQFLSVHDTKDAARRGFAERQRALREAGYEGAARLARRGLGLHGETR
jgi:hypothetical protein